MLFCNAIWRALQLKLRQANFVFAGVQVCIELDSSIGFDFLEGIVVTDSSIPSPDSMLHYCVERDRFERWNLVEQGVVCYQAASLEHIHEELQSRLHLKLGQFSPRFAFIHAAVIRLQWGTLVLPGQSEKGKSTLALSFLEDGQQIYSDEYGVLDRDGLVHAFPRPMKLRSPARTQPLPTIEYPAQDVHLIAFLEFSKTDLGPTGLQAQPLNPGLCCLKLLENCVGAQSNPQLSLEICSKVAARATSIVGCRGEAALARETLSDFLQVLSVSRKVTPPRD